MAEARVQIADFPSIDKDVLFLAALVLVANNSLVVVP